jgi:hypothetical protein
MSKDTLKRLEKAAMQWYRLYADTDSDSLEGTFPKELVDVHRACAAHARAQARAKARRRK